MKKGSMMAAFALLGSLVAAGPASAGFMAGGDQIVTVSGSPEATYHVSIAQEDMTNTYDVTVAFVSQFVAPPPNAFLDDIAFKFYSQPSVNNNQPPLASLDTVTSVGAGGTNGPPGSNWTANLIGTTQAMWTTDPNGTLVVNYHGNGAVFTGKVNVTGTVVAVQSSLFNSGGSVQYFNGVPEASSLALIVPGLLPLGYVVRRRFSRT